MTPKIIKTVQIKRIELLKPTKNGIKIVHIKKIFTSISCFLNFSIKEEFGKINIDNQWKNSINPIFENLDKSKVQSGMLLDYAMEFTDVTAYNGVLTDTTYIDANVLGDIYKTLFKTYYKLTQTFS